MIAKALITGLTGQDDSYLAELLLAKGYEVFGLVRRSSTSNLERISHRFNQIRIVSGDLLDQSSGETHSVRELVECAFNCVGLNWQDYVSVDPAFYRPDEPVQWIGGIDKIKIAIGWQPQNSWFFITCYAKNAYKIAQIPCWARKIAFKLGF